MYKNLDKLWENLEHIEYIDNLFDQAWSQFKICTPRGNKLPWKTIVEESNVEKVVEEESLEDTSTGEKGTNQECIETAQSMVKKTLSICITVTLSELLASSFTF